MAGFDMFQPGHSCVVCSAADVLSAALQTCDASARPHMAAERGGNLIERAGARARPFSPTPRVRAWQWRSGLVATGVKAGLAAINAEARVPAS
jgi:hypothetical protein